jgi:hypothetical protein
MMGWSSKEIENKYQNELKRAMPVEWRLYRKWREKAKKDGLEVVKLKQGSHVMKINMKNPEYIKFLKLFDDLDKDEDGNYLCPIHRNEHPMVQPHYEWVKKERAERRNGQHDDSPSCDRIDNKLPHKMDNCQIVCWRMNNHKGQLSLEECEDLGYWAECRQIDEAAGY